MDETRSACIHLIPTSPHPLSVLENSYALAAPLRANRQCTNTITAQEQQEQRQREQRREERKSCIIDKAPHHEHNRVLRGAAACAAVPDWYSLPPCYADSRPLRSSSVASRRHLSNPIQFNPIQSDPVPLHHVASPFAVIRNMLAHPVRPPVHDMCHGTWHPFRLERARKREKQQTKKKVQLQNHVVWVREKRRSASRYGVAAPLDSAVTRFRL